MRPPRPAAVPPALVALAALILPPAASPALAQSEERLKEAFEGTLVTVRIDMPATEDGVDVYPRARPAVDLDGYAKRLKRHGTALRTGQSVLVTKVKVKDKHIEFQLGGGGYGTFGDETSPDLAVPTSEKTAREKELEGAIRREKDPGRRRNLQQELDELRKEREREDARLRAEMAAAEEARAELIRQRALGAGSRFNLRYKEKITPDALTPEAVRAALADYLDFSEHLAGTGGASCRPAGHAASASLRKGLTLTEAEELLGAPQRTDDRSEGALRVSSRTYSKDQSLVSADFVEGVLVRYTISSQ